MKTSLEKLAHGYKYEEVTKEATTDGDGETLQKHIKKTEKEVQPNLKALSLVILKN